ncbi:MAG: ATP-binding protein [Chloroflexi bacterium]|nr:ATP-binding protein [Chloroflexota bacterium]
MRTSQLWKQWIQPVESGDLEELRRSTMLEIAGVVFAALWVMMVQAYGEPRKMVVPFILLGCSLGSFWLRQAHARLALVWLITTLLAAIACQELLFADSPAEYAFPIVVIVSSLLVSGPAIFLVAAASAAALLIVQRLESGEWLDAQQAAMPVLLILLTACAAWIGSRQMHLALDWMRQSYTRAQELLEQLRGERASLARTLKMLEEAYVRIEKMNYALIQARSAAEDARQLKAEFAANISHELRTPLNLIIGFSEMMANVPETYRGVTWSPALRGDIEQIYQSSRHLSSLIDDILDLSALEARRLGLTLQEAALQEVIADAVTMMQDLFRAKQLYLKSEIEPDLPRVRIDATRIRQVLINLLTNASRFTVTGGVTVSARRTQEEIEITVRDTGIGIAPQDVYKVFEEFGQVDGSITREHAGTGLGVPLSKRLVELHEGRMWLESQPGRGTTFYFTLPVAARSPAGLPFRTRPLALRARQVILTYEPDSLLLRTLRRQLDRYEIVPVDPGDDGARLIERHQPIALVMDMSNADAPAWPVPDDLPVIKVALAGNLQAAQALGVENYLVKPIMREQLLEAMEGLCREVRKVLIVDDDPEMVDLLARMLQSAGEQYCPFKAIGGVDGLARLREEKMDLVVLDLSMPEMDGVTVIREMKDDARLAAIPIIVITAQHPERAAAQSGLRLSLERASSASTTETLNYLQALVAALPLRGLPSTADARES